jgi:glycosyltransferase involved in cell wall biosynthesis
MDEKINYSVIIPHKNIPELLQRCLASIPRRKDVQIIVVDDNSDPDKVDFEHFPGLNDPFVEVVFTKEGKGAGYARNVGLKKAIGKWLLFADADDFYNYCINDILDEYVNSDADIIYFKHNSLDSSMYTTARRHISFNVFIDYWLYSASKADNLLRYQNVTVWTKIFRKDIISKNCIFFDEVSMANDVSFVYLAGFYANTIYADPRALYCNTARKGSIRLSKIPIEKKFDELYVLGKRYQFYKERNIPISKTKIIYANYITKLYFLDKTNFKKAKDILLNLGFTSGEILGLCIYNILIYIPNKIKNYFGKFQHNMKTSMRQSLS